MLASTMPRSEKSLREARWLGTTRREQDLTIGSGAVLLGASKAECQEDQKSCATPQMPGEVRGRVARLRGTWGLVDKSREILGVG